ncbi:DUF4105 domain-containing protein [bacterium]|nr:DUF4105 domain-containing protein [bacterium]MBU1883492.1 DUF4105 domain-containing protein [bacterium]
MLHFTEDESEIDDPRFFFAKDGKYNPKDELHATLDAFYNEKTFDDNSTACRFPARLHWLTSQLELKDLPEVTCKKYDKILERLDPKSVTLVFPAAHINSPASMFGHTFLRINSSYNSKLLSYAINYAAAADASKENGVIFAIKGLVGGYYGTYSLLPYYDKLKEYRDTEARDIWEYDLDLTPEETLDMVRHIWELGDTSSLYYFFTENCSYNMLWLLEVARPSLHLREKFTYQVIPLETVHVVEEQKIITAKNYRPSKRSELLAYEDALSDDAKEKVLGLLDKNTTIDKIKEDENLSLEQKQYIFEASAELLEYRLMKGKLKKEDYLKRFHEISSARASLGKGKKIEVIEPSNPDLGNRALRTSVAQGWRDGKPIEYIGLRPAYHDIRESNVGFLRGTQIEFLDLELNYYEGKIDLEKGTILSIESLAQRSVFFQNLSWRMKTGFDRDFMDDDSHYILTVGAGASWGNKYGYIYLLADPFTYLNTNISTGVGTSAGVVLDRSESFNTNVELTHRWYYDQKNQWLVNFSENYRMSKSISLQFSYEYKQRDSGSQDTYKASLNYFF